VGYCVWHCSWLKHAQYECSCNISNADVFIIQILFVPKLLENSSPRRDPARRQEIRAEIQELLATLPETKTPQVKTPPGQNSSRQDADSQHPVIKHLWIFLSQHSVPEINSSYICNTQVSAITHNGLYLNSEEMYLQINLQCLMAIKFYYLFQINHWCWLHCLATLFLQPAIGSDCC